VRACGARLNRSFFWPGLSARSLFDGMPQSKKISAGPSADIISALPDALLQHVLSFLQAREAVQTCVLARRWRHLWKSMPVLRVTDGVLVERVRKFMDHLLLLRDRSNLDICLFRFSQKSRDDSDYVILWIRHALLCQVRDLSMAVGFMLRNVSLVSQHLTKLQLSGVSLHVKFTDFSSCPALKDLEMTNCDIFADKICARSLERLNCDQCSFPWDRRTHFLAPSLISLQLIDMGGRSPFFDDMLVLVTAAVTFSSDCDVFCKNSDPGYCEIVSCDGCYGLGDDETGSVLLKSFSSARNLKLIAEPGTVILIVFSLLGQKAFLLQYMYDLSLVKYLEIYI
jgi:hypothetical protein